MRKLRSTPSVVTLTALLLAPGGLACDDQIELTSRWRSGEVTIDGMRTEWEGSTTYLEDEKASVGVQNDGCCLYVTLSSADQRTQFQVLGRGFTIWFDPEGGKSKSLGIRFPLSAGERPVGQPGQRPDLNRLVDRHRGPEARMELLTLDGAREVSVGEMEGIEVALNAVSGVLVYEARIPIRGGDAIPFAIGADPGQVIGVKLETPPVDSEGVRKGMGSGFGRRGEAGVGGRGGGRMGGGMGRSGGAGVGSQRPAMPEPVDIWIRVELAAADAG
jgi:hypothetical protein